MKAQALCRNKLSPYFLCTDEGNCGVIRVSSEDVARLPAREPNNTNHGRKNKKPQAAKNKAKPARKPKGKGRPKARRARSER